MKYAFKARSYGVAVRAGINGSPTLVDLKGEGKVVYRLVNEWIRPADNALTGLLFVPAGGSLPDGTPSPTDDSAVTISLYIPNDEGEPVAGTPALAVFRWPLPGVPRVVPLPFNVPFKIIQPIQTRLWSEAAVVDSLSASDRSEIIDLTNRLRDTLAQGDGVGAYQLMRVRYEDEAVAEGFSIHEMREVVISQVGVYRRFQKGQPALDTASARLTLVAGGQLCFVTRGASEAAITFEDDNIKFVMDVYVAKINGKWVIAR